jgi:dihydroxyacetone kinase
VNQKASRTASDNPAVAEYKRILQQVLENRPSGTRLSLAETLGKNRSFISQITNPSYSVLAGTLAVEKVMGAGAERGDSLAALKDLGTRVNSVTRSMGVALSSCTVPAAGKPTFQIADNEMEMGVGIHGEPGRRRVSPVMSADAIAAEIVHAIVEDLGAQSSREVLLLVNGFGGTPLLELYVMYDAACRQCAKHSLQVSAAWSAIT